MNTEKINLYWKDAHHNWLRTPEPTSLQEEFAKILIDKVRSIVAGSWNEDEALEGIEAEFLK